MNIKITPSKFELAKILINLKFPIKVIAMVLKVDPLTARKRLGKMLKASRQLAPTEILNETKMELLKFYAWILADEKGFISEFMFLPAGKDEEGFDIEIFKKSIFNYLNLSNFVAFCNGIVAVNKMNNRIQFDLELSEVELEMAKVVFGQETAQYTQTGKNLFEKILIDMHNASLFPKGEIFKSENIFAQYLEDNEIVTKKNIRFQNICKKSNGFCV